MKAWRAIIKQSNYLPIVLLQQIQETILSFLVFRGIQSRSCSVKVSTHRKRGSCDVIKILLISWQLKQMIYYSMNGIALKIEGITDLLESGLGKNSCTIEPFIWRISALTSSKMGLNSAEICQKRFTFRGHQNFILRLTLRKSKWITYFSGRSFSSFGTIAGSIESGNSTLNWMMSLPFSKGLRYVGMPSP